MRLPGERGLPVTASEHHCKGGLGAAPPEAEHILAFHISMTTFYAKKRRKIENERERGLPPVSL